MRTKLTILTILTLVFAELILAQNFTTGKISALLRTYGRLRILSGDGATRQIDRLNILVLGQPYQVFDYDQDADDIVAPVSILSPKISDFEVFGSYDNSYSNLPPAILVNQYVYGWNNQGFIISKYVVKNKTAQSINALIGFEFISQVDGQYGNEVVKYLSNKKAISVNRAPASTYTGVKLLSGEMTNLQAFEYFRGYNKDTLYYTYLIKNEIMPEYQATSEGSVVIFSQDAVSIDGNDSVVVYIGIAIGSDENELIANLDAAVAKYNGITTSVDANNFKVERFELYQNYPNPFNPTTTIAFALPEAVKEAKIRIINSLGVEVKTIKMENLSSGVHSIKFDASYLTSGVYLYKLEANNFTQTKKLILIK